MGIQTFVIFILFLGASFYLGKTIYKTFTAKNGCASNCKCGVDFSKVEVKK
jgi:hypothetical protein